jgi:hypothetical protein
MDPQPPLPERQGPLDISDTQLLPIVLASLSCLAWESVWRDIVDQQSREEPNLDLSVVFKTPDNQRFRKAIQLKDLNIFLRWQQLEDYLYMVDTPDSFLAWPIGHSEYQLCINLDTEDRRSKNLKVLLAVKIHYHRNTIGRWRLVAVVIKNRDTDFTVPCRNRTI